MAIEFEFPEENNTVLCDDADALLQDTLPNGEANHNKELGKDKYSCYLCVR